MDKQESKLTSTASAFDNKCRRRRKGEAVEPHTASTRPLILPNPYVSDSNLTRNLSDGSVTPAGNGDNTRSRGYSSHRPVREATNRNRSIHTKTLKNHNDPQGRIIGKKSVDTQKKGFRDVRSAPNSARKAPPQTNFVPFEVKMADFPQLAGDSLIKGAHPVTQKESWGPGSQSTIPQSSWKWVETRGSTDPLQNPPDVKVSAPVSPAAQPLVTSWANIASQPPKKQPVFTDQTISSNAMQTKDAAQNEEGPPGKKKRKKKKKTKNSGEDAEAESQDQIFCQEPPKFEDDEEFPDLAVAVSGADKFITSSKKKLCNEENQREGEKHWPGDLNKEKLPAGKTQPTEAAKTGQKAEKISGKKSKVPVQLDIGNVLAALEKQQQSKKSKQDAKPVVLSVGGGLPVVQKQAPALKKPHWQQDKIAHNPLDSTSPLVKKGKQREVPKAKKPTPLKKIILKEREERKQRRLQEERGLLPEDESTITNDAAEEQDDENTDDVGCLSQEFDDLLTLNGTDLIIGDVDKETDKDETVQQEISSAELLLTNTPKIHSRRFRDYCSQMLNKDLDECVTSLLKELVRFQDRLYQKDPMKARMKRRIVMGLREVMKHLKLRKVKCVIISPNCERIQSKGGLDEALHTIINMCREQAVPFVFALSRKALGRCVNKAVPVSLVGIFNYDGAQEYYHRMIELSSEARRAYEEKLSSLELKDQEDSEQDANPEQEINSFTEEPEEPEYLKFWKKMLEKESSHAFLNFEEQLSSLRLDSDCTENTEEES